MLRDDNYIVIKPFMVKLLKLKGSELLIVGLIHGFSQDGESWFRGSAQYVSEWVGIAEKNVLRSLKSLCEKNILIKQEHFVNNKAKRCFYKLNYAYVSGLQNGTPTGLQNGTPTGLQNGTPTGLQNGTQYHSINIIDENIADTAQKDFAPEPALFSDEFNSNNQAQDKEKKVAQKKESSSDKKTLFRNSPLYTLVIFNEDGTADYSAFEKLYATPEFTQVDLIYYFHCVSDWSDQKNMKRTKNGWIATVRNFMRGDIEKGKLKVKAQYQPAQTKVDVAGALDYLNEYD